LATTDKDLLLMLRKIYLNNSIQLITVILLEFCEFYRMTD